MKFATLVIISDSPQNIPGSDIKTNEGFEDLPAQ